MTQKHDQFFDPVIRKSVIQFFDILIRKSDTQKYNPIFDVMYPIFIVIRKSAYKFFDSVMIRFFTGIFWSKVIRKSDTQKYDPKWNFSVVRKSKNKIFESVVRKSKNNFLI